MHISVFEICIFYFDSFNFHSVIISVIDFMKQYEAVDETTGLRRKITMEEDQ